MSTVFEMLILHQQKRVKVSVCVGKMRAIRSKGVAHILRLTEVFLGHL